MNIQLRPATVQDLEHFFAQQAHEAAIQMAAFTSENPFDKAAYMLKWTALLGNPEIHVQSIMLEDQNVGCVAKYVMEGDAELTYAIDPAKWGNGIASQAVQAFLKLENTRPIHARVAYDNIGSQKVLEKAGFKKVGQVMAYANARKKEILEYVYMLSSS